MSFEPKDRDINSRPIIGVLAQELNAKMKESIGNYDSYIAASYVKAIEASGAKVVPIFLNRDEEYYRTMLQCINGLLLPGGNTWFFEDDNITPRKDGYVRATEIVYNEVKKINDSIKERGMVFPTLAICLGLELLLFIDNNKAEIREDFNCTLKSPLKLNLKSACLNNEAWNDWINMFNEPLHYFSHRFYITEDKMETDSIKSEWSVLATTNATVLDSKTNKNEKITFVSVIESKNYPILGLQFHPEKVPFEWNKTLPIPHSEKAIKASRNFFDWLVRESKKNNFRFENDKEYESLINNYPIQLTHKKSSFDELYLFEGEVNG